MVNEYNNLSVHSRHMRAPSMSEEYVIQTEEFESKYLKEQKLDEQKEFESLFKLSDKLVDCKGYYKFTGVTYFSKLILLNTYNSIILLYFLPNLIILYKYLFYFCFNLSDFLQLLLFLFFFFLIIFI